MASPSFAIRESTTLSSTWLQNGHRTDGRLLLTGTCKDRKLPAQSAHARTYKPTHGLILMRRQDLVNGVGDLVHLLLPHAARGHDRRAKPDATGDGRGPLIIRDRVLVDRDARLVERRFGFLAGYPLGLRHVHQHQMGIRASRHD